MCELIVSGVSDVQKAPLLSQEGRLRRQKEAAKPPLTAQTGGSGTAPVKMIVKEPPRRASRVSPPDSGGEFYAAPRLDYSFTVTRHMVTAS